LPTETNAKDFAKQKLFNGRDHSWMQFNRRVLEEAEDATNPLLERVKFLAITRQIWMSTSRSARPD